MNQTTLYRLYRKNGASYSNLQWPPKFLNYSPQPCHWEAVNLLRCLADQLIVSLQPSSSPKTQLVTVKTPILPSSIKPGTTMPVSVKSNSNVKIAFSSGQQLVRTSSTPTVTTVGPVKTQRVILPSPAPTTNFDQNDSLIQTKIVPMTETKVIWSSTRVVLIDYKLYNNWLCFKSGFQRQQNIAGTRVSLLSPKFKIPKLIVVYHLNTSLDQSHT